MYTMSSLGLVGYNKAFLYAAVRAPGSTHDARLLKSTCLYQSILKDSVRTITLKIQKRKIDVCCF